MTTLEDVRREERSAREQLRRIAKAQQVAATQHERERWEKFKDYRRGKHCGCTIVRGMTHDELVEVNLRGRAPERDNCADPFYICPVLVRALDLVRHGGRL